jgi:hypothetical protein
VRGGKFAALMSDAIIADDNYFSILASANIPIIGDFLMAYFGLFCYIFKLMFMFIFMFVFMLIFLFIFGFFESSNILLIYSFIILSFTLLSMLNSPKKDSKNFCLNTSNKSLYSFNTIHNMSVSKSY